MRKKRKSTSPRYLPVLSVVLAIAVAVFFLHRAYLVFSRSKYGATVYATKPVSVLNVQSYNKKMVLVANYGTSTAATGIATTSSAWNAADFSISSPKNPWPVKTPYPGAGALLPFKRIVIYYGNFYSKQMGILGEYPPEEVLEKLRTVSAEWETADPTTPVVPALAYIAVVAQESAGKDGKYRLRMPDAEIDKAISMAEEVKGVVFLDVQVGLSTLQAELPALEKYLKMPKVHLAIDPEFSMKTGKKPGTVIGTMNAADVNYAASYLASLVKAYNLPPKILVAHRFTQNMIVGYKSIKPLPEVQIVMDMDGWGAQPNKISVYNKFVRDEPIQFGGIKLFYKNDLKKPSTGLLTPAQLLTLKPQPLFIEYQ